MTVAMKKDEIETIIQHTIDTLDHRELALLLQKLRVPLRTRTLEFEWHKSEGKHCTAWEVCLFHLDNILIVYTEGGFADEGYPWGLISYHQRTTGSPQCWYASLEMCALEFDGDEIFKDYSS